MGKVYDLNGKDLTKTDATLRVPEEPADAAEVGKKNDAQTESLKAEKSRAEGAEQKLQQQVDTLNAGGLNLKEDLIRTQVDSYLTQHPEAMGTAVAEETTRAKAAEEENAKGIGQLKEDLEDVSDEIARAAPYKELCKMAKNQKFGTVFLTEKAPVNVAISGSVGTIHGRNRYNISKQNLSFSSYSSNHNYKKSNGGFEIDCNVTSETSSVYAVSSFYAEFDGHMIFSCEADCTGNVKDLLVKIKRGDSYISDSCAGRGRYVLGLDVSKGDLISILFYTSILNPDPNTLHYNNIMVAYDGFYDYCAYSPDIEPVYVKNTYNIPADTSVMTNHSISGSGGKYYITISNDISDMRNYPATVYDIPSITATDATVCEISGANGIITKTTGIWVSISPSGTVYLNVNGLNRTSATTYLQSNPIVITYETTELSSTSKKEMDTHIYQEGEIVELQSGGSITYEYSLNTKKKRLVCFGDSITGMFESDSSYPDMISRMSDIDAINVGFAGCCMADHRTDKYVPFCMNRLADAITSGDYSTQDAQAESIGGYYPLHVSRLKQIDWKAVDYISIFYGTNDWGMNKIMLSGKETDKSICTQDALKYTIETISRIYPWIKIVVIAPYWRSKSAGFDSNKDANDNGDYLYQFSDMIVSTAEEYNLPSINLYRNLGANVYTNRYFTKDGTHPTEMCKEIIAKRLIECIGLY